MHFVLVSSSPEIDHHSLSPLLVKMDRIELSYSLIQLYKFRYH